MCYSSENRFVLSPSLLIEKYVYYYVFINEEVAIPLIILLLSKAVQWFNEAV